MLMPVLSLWFISAMALENAPAYYARWTNGIPEDTAFFPLGVWLQEPSDAAAYKAAGINLYIGLWAGPTTTQLQTLKDAGMRVICDQNTSMLANFGSTIVGWMQNDEPDNAQANGSGGYDPCVDTALIKQYYTHWRAADTTRPIYMNLGRGVADTGWYGRGACTGNTRLYPGYIRGCDIVSYDVYPYTGSDGVAYNNPWYVALGIDNLNGWTDNAKPAWCFIECTQIGSTGTKPTPAQVKAMVWMALIHDAKGIEYFCHQFSPAMDTRAPLHDPTTLAAITAINQRITALAPVLNDSTYNNRVSVATSNAGVPVDRMVKVHGNAVYIFAASMRSGATTATFTISGLTGTRIAEVLDENRNVTVAGGVMSDAFANYQVHLYRISTASTAVNPDSKHHPASNAAFGGCRSSGNSVPYSIAGASISAGNRARGIVLHRQSGTLRKQLRAP